MPSLYAILVLLLFSRIVLQLSYYSSSVVVTVVAWAESSASFIGYGLVPVLHKDSSGHDIGDVRDQQFVIICIGWQDLSCVTIFA